MNRGTDHDRTDPGKAEGTLLRVWLRRCVVALILVPAVGFLTAGSCHWHAHHCDDDDFGDDDCHHHYDDDHHAAAANQRDERREPNFRIESCRIEESSEEDRFPIASMTEIEDVELFAPASTQGFDEDELRTFCERVYAANLDRLGVASGELAWAGSQFGADAIELRWVQVFETERPAGREAGELVYVLDALGRLREIHNSTWLR